MSHANNKSDPHFTARRRDSSDLNLHFRRLMEIGKKTLIVPYRPNSIVSNFNQHGWTCMNLQHLPSTYPLELIGHLTLKSPQ